MCFIYNSLRFKYRLIHFSEFTPNLFTSNSIQLSNNKYFFQKCCYSSISTNVSTASTKPPYLYNSFVKFENQVNKYNIYYQTIDILKRLNYTDFDKFQSDIFSWVKSRYNNTSDISNKLNYFVRDGNKYENTSYSNVSLIVGGPNSGKTSTCLLALSDVVNDPCNEGSRLHRDKYRSKMMVYGNLKGYKSGLPPGVRKINGIPKFNWNSYVVPAAVVLVPFRELGLNIFNFCSKIDIRSHLLAGGKGYKKQTDSMISLNHANPTLGNNVNLSHGKDKDNVDVIIATPEMFYRSLTGSLDDIKIDMKFIKLLVFEHADVLNDEEYLEEINRIINLIYVNSLNLLYISRFKTNKMLHNIEQLLLVNNSDSNDYASNNTTNDKVTGINSSSEVVKEYVSNELHIIEKPVDNFDHIKKVFIHTVNNDRLELLIDLLHELNLPNSGNIAPNTIDTSSKCSNYNSINVQHGPIANAHTSNGISNRNKTVIYCKNKKCNIFLKYSLLDRGFNVINMFGGMNYEERTNNVKSFQNKSNILITTSFASRFKFECNISQVILFDFPKDYNEYINSISSLSGSDKKIYMFFNNKNVPVIKQIQEHTKSFSNFEFRNLTPKLGKKLHLHQNLILKQMKTSGIRIPSKKSKLLSKRNKMVNNKSTLGPKNKRIMKKYYLMTKAVKKLEFLRKRGILKKNQLLPRTPDKNVEASDSQEFIQMKRSPDGFLQIIPKRRSRIRVQQENNQYDKESVVIPGAPTYESKIDKYNTHF